MIEGHCSDCKRFGELYEIQVLRVKKGKIELPILFICKNCCFEERLFLDKNGVLKANFVSTSTKCKFFED